MSKLTFDINNGNKQVWEQHEHDGSVHLYNLEQDWEKNNGIIITPSEMVMLSNLYREAKRFGIMDAFINPRGQAMLAIATDDVIISALERQILKKVKPNEHNQSVGKCPVCDTELCIEGEHRMYCPNCGQAIDCEASE